MKKFKKVISILTAIALFVGVLPLQRATTTVSAVTVPENYEVARRVTLDFNTENKGWSGTNGNLSDTLTQVLSNGEGYLTLKTPNGNGYNFELADGSDSTTAFTMKSNTKYSITFDAKLVSGESGNLALAFGTKAAYDPNLAKPIAKSWTAGDMSRDSYTPYSFEWTTTETMAANTYNGGSNENICDRLYFVANGSVGEYAIDNVVITEYRPKTVKTDVTLTFSEDGKGYSATNGTLNDQLKQVISDSESYLDLKTPNGNGYNFELADSNASTDALKLKGNTTYDVTVRFKVANAGSEGYINLYSGTQAQYSTDLSKYRFKQWALSSYNDGEWHTVSCEFTTTETMAADTYDQGLNSNICDRLYIVASGGGENGCEFYVDEVTVTERVESSDGNEGAEKEMYNISDFNVKPLTEDAIKGGGEGKWYYSVRWFIDTVDSNSVMHYQYAYDIAENAPNTSGIRGVSAKGTNGTQHAMACLIYEDNKPVILTQGKSYRISFKYKVLSLEKNSYISFVPMRGKCQAGWDSSYGVGSVSDQNDGQYIIDIAYSTTSDWVDASYTFTANYGGHTEYNVLQLGGAGYGDALIDDIKVEEIDVSEVLPNNTDASTYEISVSDGKVTINSYKLNNSQETELVIPPTIARRPLAAIGDYAFLYNRFLTTVTIMNGPTSIGEYAFEYARHIQTINIPASVTSIGKCAFYDMDELKAINVDPDNPAYTSVDGVLYNKDMTELIVYPIKKSDTSFTVPSTVTKIADGAFMSAQELQTVVLPDGLKTIGRRAFAYCGYITSINFPSSIETIGASAFRQCSGITAESFELSDNVDIKENAFIKCKKLYNVGAISQDDETVDIKDANLLVKHLANLNGTLGVLGEAAADINGDGSVDLMDAVILKRHLADWSGYKSLPCDGTVDREPEYYNAYNPDELTVSINLYEKNSRKVEINRDIEYDPNKEDIIIILVTGQSNSGTNGYQQEYEYKYTTIHGNTAHPDYEITAEPDRPAVGTVFSGTMVTVLDETTDVYYKTDTANLNRTMGGYTPAMGKALNEATGAKVVFVQANQGAVGMHEWVSNPEDYDCPCSDNGKGVLYSNAIANYTKTYQTLKEDYNIIATAYVYNQGEHEEYSPYTEGATIHDDWSYADALQSMHYSFLADCEIDCGGMYMPRSFFARYPDATDTEENSRRPSIARTAMYNMAHVISDSDKAVIPNFFIFSNIAETISPDGELKPDPTNSIHYSQKAYNAIGRQNADSMLKYFGFIEPSEFTGISVFNSIGKLLFRFDAEGNVEEDNDNLVDFHYEYNNKLYFRIEPTGTMYAFDISCHNTGYNQIVDKFGNVSQQGFSKYNFFRLVVNMPK